MLPLLLPLLLLPSMEQAPSVGNGTFLCGPRFRPTLAVSGLDHSRSRAVFMEVATLLARSSFSSERN